MLLNAHSEVFELPSRRVTAPNPIGRRARAREVWKLSTPPCELRKRFENASDLTASSTRHGGGLADLSPCRRASSAACGT
jgi:hypothetical protein